MICIIEIKIGKHGQKRAYQLTKKRWISIPYNKAIDIAETDGVPLVVTIE